MHPHPLLQLLTNKPYTDHIVYSSSLPSFLIYIILTVTVVVLLSPHSTMINLQTLSEGIPDNIKVL